MKVIVTGGAGFIGSHLVESLIRLNHNVIVLDNFSTGRFENIKHLKKKIKIIRCDLSEKGRWEKSFKNVDWVFHLAALADIVPSIQKPETYFRSNIVGTHNILVNAVKFKVKRFIYTASSSCYGIPKKFPTKENEKIDTQYPYALTKRLGEELVLHFSKIYKLKSISLRFFNVYGTRSRTSGTYGAMFGVFLAQKLKGFPLTIVGNGKQTRDFTYVTDAVDSLILAAKSKFSGKIYNVGSGKTVAINKIIKLLNVKETIYIPKRPGEPDCTFADIKKIKKELKWRPKISIEDGVKKLLKEINYWSNAPVWTRKKIKNATRDWFKFLG